MSTTTLHIHEYERMKNKDFYRCIHPKCTHSTHKERILGKEVICHECKKPFIVGLDKRRQQLKNRFMRCDFCVKSPKAVTAEMAKDIISRNIQELEAREMFKEINEDKASKI